MLMETRDELSQILWECTVFNLVVGALATRRQGRYILEVVQASISFCTGHGIMLGLC